MKHSIKIAMASLLVLGSSQAQASEVDLDVTDIITQNVTSYINQVTAELEQSISQSLSFDAKAALEQLVNQAQEQTDVTTQSTMVVTTEVKAK
ncbi:MULTISPECIES: hypothetical protein [unclassified Pseudoalteromonas]|uniref:hypothetical protein n=1 Tax=unclassified Pseudoalteromonas TaxID=194690 RepID=UPI0006D6689E|nr:MULTISPECIES: hypothetical protein [unclassified Pseudoalteromonas]KPZ58448.1 hypothetical protein AN393_00256 [Pseudoalteromonas sp. P1-25]KPZ60616.1 hypothetical protein AN391_00228 [Pseudoalteromonas sp. P1-13-1a]